MSCWEDVSQVFVVSEDIATPVNLDIVICQCGWQDAETTLNAEHGINILWNAGIFCISYSVLYVRDISDALTLSDSATFYCSYATKWRNLYV